MASPRGIVVRSNKREHKCIQEAAISALIQQNKSFVVWQKNQNGSLKDIKDLADDIHIKVSKIEATNTEKERSDNQSLLNMK